MPTQSLHPALVLRPTLSLLRMSAAQRLLGAAAMLAGLWLLVVGVIG